MGILSWKLHRRINENVLDNIFNAVIFCMIQCAKSSQADCYSHYAKTLWTRTFEHVQSTNCHCSQRGRDNRKKTKLT